MSTVRLAALALSVAALPASAGTVLTGHYTITGDLCVGYYCSGAETFDATSIKLKEYDTGITFADASTGSFSTNDWRLKANATLGPGDYFAIEDLDGAGQVFRINAGAPQNNLVIDATGNIGFGTAFPMTSLHIMAADSPALRLEQDGQGNEQPQSWDILGNEVGLSFRDQTNGNEVIRIAPGSRNTAALAISGFGRVGFGTFNPQAAMHLRRNNGSAQLFVEETAGTTGARTLLNLQNNGRPEIVMGNTATNGEWSFGAGTDFFLKTGPIGSPSGAKTRALTVKANGDAFLRGTLTTGGTTCGGGCDRVFTDHRIIPAPDYAAQMWAQGHLPHVGPTVEGTPLNLSEKLGGMLNALEHAHVFIDAQRSEISDLRGTVATLEAGKAAQDARIARLEARLAALTGEN